MTPPGARTSRTSLVGAVQTLPVIVEDEVGDDGATTAAAPPAVPPRSAHRPDTGRSSSGRPTPLSFLPPPASHYNGRELAQGQPRQQQQRRPSQEPEQHCPPPPSFAHAGKRRLRSELAELKAELGDGAGEVQRSRFPWLDRLQGRGGWCRVCFAVSALVLTIIAVGLGVGLGLRLGQRNAARSSPMPNMAGQTPVDLFPAGAYSFTAALTSVARDCAADPAAFGCYPFSTYNTAFPDASAATFQWVIRPLGGPRYSISSANPFAPQFDNMPTELIDAGSGSERFVFNFNFSKAFVPTKPLAGRSGVTATKCWYNATMVEATVWTRERASYPAGIVRASAPVNATWDFEPWPYRFNMTQRQAPGVDVPDCRDLDGKPVGPGLGAAPGSAGECACMYQNAGLG